MRSAGTQSGRPSPLRRDELEHAIRAATEIIQQDSVIVIGSQSILGTWGEDDLPGIATMSDEVDICPVNDDDAESLATLLDSVAGEWSSFHEPTSSIYRGWEGKRLCCRRAGRNVWSVSPAKTPEEGSGSAWTPTIYARPRWLPVGSKTAYS